MMKETFFKMILSVDETINMVVMIISIVSGIAAIVSEIRVQKEQKKNTWIWKCIIIASILVIVCTVARSNMAEVPNVVGKIYQDACHILSDSELNYNLVRDNGVYVMEQKPVAGTIVDKDSFVELITQPIGNNSEVKKIWEESLGVDYGNVAITFKDTSLILAEEGTTKECYGPVITDYTVKKAYLLEENVGVEYHDFVIEDNVMIFRDIPQGIHFRLIVLLDGYEEAKTEVIISSQNMVDGTYSFTWGITSSSRNMLLPTSFYVADAEESTIENIEYMPGVKLWMQWPGKIAWRGDYFTNTDGEFPYSILISENQTVKVSILDPFDNGVDYECEVILYAPKIGESNPQDIIFLKKDGTCDVISTEEYFAR